MLYLAMAFEILFFVFSSSLDTIKDLYLFWESHFDRQRDFEKLDDFMDVSYQPASN